MQAQLKRQIREERLSDYITLLGHVPYDELPTVYADHDLFLYPGRWDEPFGRVFLEAMSSGTPVFATDVGNVENIIGDCGRVARYSNSVEFSAALNSMLDHDLLESYASRTSEQLERYYPEAVGAKFLDLYESL
ncbi:hypothetical protein GCM10009647_056940 [Streptomyces sanglieri]